MHHLRQHLCSRRSSDQSGASEKLSATPARFLWSTHPSHPTPLPPGLHLTAGSIREQEREWSRLLIIRTEQQVQSRCPWAESSTWTVEALSKRDKWSSRSREWNTTEYEPILNKRTSRVQKSIRSSFSSDQTHFPPWPFPFISLLGFVFVEDVLSVQLESAFMF